MGNSPNTWLFDHLLTNQKPDESKSNSNSNEKAEKRVRRRDTFFEKFKSSRESKHFDMNLWGVCSGENFQTELEKSRLFCWYEFAVHPRYRIAPLKMEFLSRQPDVYMIYNFVGNSMIKKVLTAILDENTRIPSSPFRKDKRSNVKLDSNGRGLTSFIWDGRGTTHGIFPLAQNVQDATGLKCLKENEVDHLYVKSYTWATYATPHTDSMWIANAIHYLNHVEFGGLTAFPRLGFAVKPVKGALLLWYNQHRDQTTDLLTEHKSCPIIIYGRKQIATNLLHIRSSSNSRVISNQVDDSKRRSTDA